VEIVEGALTAEYRGQRYYFCSAGCRRQFERDPERFLTADRR
jgi:YHS domain-containing protein